MSQQAQSLFISQVQGWGQESHDVIASMASPRMISSEGLGVWVSEENRKCPQQPSMSRPLISCPTPCILANKRAMETKAEGF